MLDLSFYPQKSESAKYLNEWHSMESLDILKVCCVSFTVTKTVHSSSICIVGLELTISEDFEDTFQLKNQSSSSVLRYFFESE